MLFVFPCVFRIVLRSARGNDFLFDFRLILNEFNIRYLLFRRRRNQEEERKNECGHHGGEVEYVRAACRLWHLQNVFRIYMFALDQCGVIVCITYRIEHESEEERDYN